MNTMQRAVNFYLDRGDINQALICASTFAQEEMAMSLVRVFPDLILNPDEIESVEEEFSTYRTTIVRMKTGKVHRLSNVPIGTFMDRLENG